MGLTSVQIIPCPSKWRALALRMVLRSLPLEQQDAIAASAGEAPSLFVAVAGGVPTGACWAQPQPGNTAVLWPPQLTKPDSDAAHLLLLAATRYLDQNEIGLTQVLLNDHQEPAIALLERHGFAKLADLIYLSWEQFALTADADDGQELFYEPFRPGETPRLAYLIEQTYFDTLDCPLLNGVRSMDDVLAGYQATGDYSPNLWYFVRHCQRDVGVLLLTTHRAMRHVELLYMGVVPSERGRRFGDEIIRFAQTITAAADCDRLVLAVDADNHPAAQIYQRAGFQPWARRLVYVRLKGGCPTSVAR